MPPIADCHGKKFNPARFVTGTFPCLKASLMPRVPFVLAGDRARKKPAWLNDPLNYHDRGNIDFGSCSQACFEQGDFFGLDDLFTEKPNVQNGLAQIYASWITRFKVDGFRVDTAKHVNAAFFRLWVPKIRAAARAAGSSDFPIFGEVTLNDAVDLSAYVRDRGLPQVLDFPFQEVATGYASGAAGAKGIANRMLDDDYFRTPNGVDPAFTTFLGNHDLGRAAQQILSQAPGLSSQALLQHVLLGYDLLYLLRGAPAVLYGDEVGMIGSGGDQQARQDMFPTQVGDWKTQTRVGGPPIGAGSSLGITDNPIEAQLKLLASIRDAHPELATGATVVRYAKDAVLVVSRIDLATHREAIVGFNNGGTDREPHRPDGARDLGRAPDPAGLGSARHAGGDDPGAAAADPEAECGQRQPDELLPARGVRSGRAGQRRVRDPPQRRRVAAGRDRRLGALPRVRRSAQVQEARTRRRSRRRAGHERHDRGLEGRDVRAESLAARPRSAARGPRCRRGARARP